MFRRGRRESFLSRLAPCCAVEPRTNSVTSAPPPSVTAPNAVSEAADVLAPLPVINRPSKISIGSAVGAASSKRSAFPSRTLGSLTAWQILASDVQRGMDEAVATGKRGRNSDPFDSTTKSALKAPLRSGASTSDVWLEDGISAPGAPALVKDGSRQFHRDYEVVQELGRGAFGTALMARHLVDGSLVCVKVLETHSMGATERRMIRDEVQLLSSFKHNPNIIRYIDSYSDGSDGKLYIVMEYAQDGDLEQFLRAQGGNLLSEEQILLIFVQLCLALQAVHSKVSGLLHRLQMHGPCHSPPLHIMSNKDSLLQGVIHRDIKPANLLIRGGLVKLGDFGISKALTPGKSFANTMVGTPFYFSPELVEDKPYGTASDVWACGCVLYELATLNRPFRGGSVSAVCVKILSGRYSPLPAAFSADLHRLVELLLQRRPEERPTISEVLNMPVMRAALKSFRNLLSECPGDNRKASHFKSLEVYQLDASSDVSLGARHTLGIRQARHTSSLALAAAEGAHRHSAASAVHVAKEQQQHILLADTVVVDANASPVPGADLASALAVVAADAGPKDSAWRPPARPPRHSTFSTAHHLPASRDAVGAGACEAQPDDSASPRSLLLPHDGFYSLDTTVDEEKQQQQRLNRRAVQESGWELELGTLLPNPAFLLPPTAAGAGTAAEALRSGMAAMQPEQQFSDFTTATALERFIATLETCLTTWRDRELDGQLPQYQQFVVGGETLKAQLQHRLPFRAEPYTLTLHLAPLVPHHMASLGEEGLLLPDPTPEGRSGQWPGSSGGDTFGQLSAAMPPVMTSLQLQDAPHRLQQWFGAGAFLLLMPDSYSGRVLDEGEASTLLSAAAVALSHAHISWPMLLPVHDAVRDSYRGVAVGPSAEGAATFQLETDSLHSNRLPPELLQLDQQLLLFAKRLGVAAAPTAMAACLAMVGDLDSHVPPASMAADAAAAGANRGSSLGCRLAPHPSDLRIALSVRHSYALPVQGEASDGGESSSWADEPGDSSQAGEWDEGAPWRPWAAQADPIGCLELDLVWCFPDATTALQAHAADDGQPGSVTCCVPAQATDWRLLALGASYERDSGHRGFVLLEKPRRFLQLQSIAGPTGRLIQLGRAVVDPATLPGGSSFYGMLLALLESCKWAANAPALGNLSSADWWPQQGAYLPPAPPDWVLQEAIRDIFELPDRPAWPVAPSASVAWPAGTAGQHGCLGKAAPLGALISRFTLHALALGSPRAVAELWSRFVGTLRQAYWEQLRSLPRMRIEQQQQEHSVGGSAAPEPHSTANSLRHDTSNHAGRTPLAPQLQFSLLHQKLQLLDLCIHVQQEQRDYPPQHQEPLLVGEGWEGASSCLDDSPKSLSTPGGSEARASPDQVQQAWALLAAESSPGMEASAEASRAGFEAEAGQVRSQQQRQQRGIGGQQQRCQLAATAQLLGTSSSAVAELQPEGVSGVLLGATLHLHPGRPLHVPLVLEPPPQTEDQIAERHAAVQSLLDEGHQAVPTGMGAQLQGRMLVSDMQAFKAANPGCCMLDFVRWHSPKDCCQSEQHGGWELSGRMASEGNTWQQLWAAAVPMPAAAQRPLFDAELEGERALHFLETLPPPALFAELLSLGFSAAVQLLSVSGRAAELAPVLRQLECLVAAGEAALQHGVRAVSEGPDLSLSPQGQTLQRLPSWVSTVYGSGLSGSSYRDLLLLLGCGEQAVVAAHSLLLRLGGCSRHPHVQHREQGVADGTHMCTETAAAIIAAALGEDQLSSAIDAPTLQQHWEPGAAVVKAAAAVNLGAHHRREVEALLMQTSEWDDGECDSEAGSADGIGRGEWLPPFQREWVLEVHGDGNSGGRGPAQGGDCVLHRWYVKALPSEYQCWLHRVRLHQQRRGSHQQQAGKPLSPATEPRAVCDRAVMADRYQVWIERAAAERPQLAAALADLGELYHRKLWHQLTVQLEQCIERPEFQEDGFLVELYQNFVSGFAHKINLLKLAFHAVAVGKQMSTPEEGAAFIQDVIANLEASKQPDMQQPILYLRMQLAQYALVQGHLQDCKRTFEAGREDLESLTDVIGFPGSASEWFALLPVHLDCWEPEAAAFWFADQLIFAAYIVDPQVSASVFYAASLYHKQQKEYAQYYRATLMYLAYVSQDTLPQEFRQALAVDISLAALLGEDVYNFGELLLHPIINALDEGGYGWLHEMLECYNSGDIHRYDDLCAQHAALLNGQPALVAHERRLREKITILCLMELISSLPPDQRTIALSTVAERTKLPLDGVEFLLMKALALHLVEGVIDQVDGSVQVSWVQPRILTLPQINGLRARLDGWVDKVSSAAMTLENEAFKFWTDELLEAFVKEEFADFYPEWIKIEPRIKQLDSSRYMLMHRFGGIYMDVDVECVRSLNGLIDPLPPGAAWVGDWPEPSILASAPNNQLWLHVLSRIARVWRTLDAWHSTGPAGLGAAILEYVQEHGAGVLVPWLTADSRPQFTEFVKGKNATVPWYVTANGDFQLPDGSPLVPWHSPTYFPNKIFPSFALRLGCGSTTEQQRTAFS
ncbi:26S proteasome non-ATPase regulatory subunit 13 A [Chlorella vulgaris]